MVEHVVVSTVQSFFMHDLVKTLSPIANQRNSPTCQKYIGVVFNSISCCVLNHAVIHRARGRRDISNAGVLYPPDDARDIHIHMRKQYARGHDASTSISVVSRALSAPASTPIHHIIPSHIPSQHRRPHRSRDDARDQSRPRRMRETHKASHGISIPRAHGRDR